MTYVPKPEERIQVPQVTRGQTIVNLLVTLSAMSHSYEGAGFARNGQAAQADGSWLRLSQRLKNDAGRKGRKAGAKKGTGRGAKSKMAERRMVSIKQLFGQLTVDEVEPTEEELKDV